MDVLHRMIARMYYEPGYFQHGILLADSIEEMVYIAKVLQPYISTVDFSDTRLLRQFSDRLPNWIAIPPAQFFPCTPDVLHRLDSIGTSLGVVSYAAELRRATRTLRATYMQYLGWCEGADILDRYMSAVDWYSLESIHAEIQRIQSTSRFAPGAIETAALQLDWDALQIQ